MLRCAVAGVKQCKANTTLKLLDLGDNKVGNEGAAALAKAVEATVLTCGLKLHVLGFEKCCFAAMRYDCVSMFFAACGAAILQLPVT